LLGFYVEGVLSTAQLDKKVEKGERLTSDEFIVILSDLYQVIRVLICQQFLNRCEEETKLDE
jgi:hypothetical protein